MRKYRNLENVTGTYCIVNYVLVEISRITGDRILWPKHKQTTLKHYIFLRSATSP